MNTATIIIVAVFLIVVGFLLGVYGIVWALKGAAKEQKEASRKVLR